MQNDIHLFAFGTFGLPNGFKQSSFIGKSDISRIKNFDLNPNAICVFENSKIYAFRKENAYNAISIILYTAAKEKASNRLGTFIGSSLVGFDSDILCIESIMCLEEFHLNLISNPENINQGVLQVSHSDQFKILGRPKKYNTLLKSNRNEINFKNNTPKGNLVIYSKTDSFEKLINLFEQSKILLDKYECIYFTENHQVAEFVTKKNIFKIVDDERLNIEINNYNQELINENLIKQNSFKKQLNLEKIDVEELDENVNKKFENYIKELKANHQKNLDFIKNQESNFNYYLKIHQKYLSFLQENCKSQSRVLNIEESQVRFLELKKEYKLAIANLKFFKLSQISTTNENQKVLNSLPKEDEKNENIDFKDDFLPNYYKIATFILSFALIGLLIYIFIFDEKKSEPSIIPVQNNEIIIQKPTDTLSPKPNGNLSVKEMKLLHKNFKNLAPIDEIINLIFKKNPTEIEKPYKAQFDLYRDQLIELNPNSFEKKSEIYYYIDSIKIIPSYKIK